jgi:hypothetical protein
MVKLGLIKSKIEKKLLESYSNKSFKYELNNFKNYVLSNKKLSALYYHYDELTSKKGLNESICKEFINETLQKIKEINLLESEIKDLKKWVSDIKSKNNYKIVDDLISENLDVNKILTIKMKLSKVLSESDNLANTKSNIPIKSMVNIANQTLMKHFETLNESDKIELNEILNLGESELVKEYSKNIKEVIEKLTFHLNESNDQESKEKINETIKAIKNKEINRLEFYKLSKLNKSL